MIQLSWTSTSQSKNAKALCTVLYSNVALRRSKGVKKDKLISLNENVFAILSIASTNNYLYRMKIRICPGQGGVEA